MSYQELVVFSDSVPYSQIAIVLLYVWPKLGLTYAKSIIHNLQPLFLKVDKTKIESQFITSKFSHIAFLFNCIYLTSKLTFPFIFLFISFKLGGY